MKKKFYHNKNLGQHFLKDKGIIERIVDSADITEDDYIWEIGTGKGILTEALIETGAEINTFEIDKRLHNLIEKKFGDKINLIKKDIMRIDWKDYFPKDKKIKVVANIPYQITSPFLFKIVDNIEHFDSVFIMIQKEVAERITASPGSKTYGRLSVKLQYFFNPELLFKVPPHKFTPPPKVDSAVIKLIERKDKPEIENLKLFWQIVNAGFLNRRKMLRRNLRSLMPKDKIKEMQEELEIDLRRRGETLNEEEYISLYNTVLKYR